MVPTFKHNDLNLGTSRSLAEFGDAVVRRDEWIIGSLNDEYIAPDLGCRGKGAFPNLWFIGFDRTQRHQNTAERPVVTGQSRVAE